MYHPLHRHNGDCSLRVLAQDMTSQVGHCWRHHQLNESTLYSPLSHLSGTPFALQAVVGRHTGLQSVVVWGSATAKTRYCRP